MATREENLKKINDELEKLDDEQLEEIAGGKLFDRFGRNRAIDANQEIQEDAPHLTMPQH